MKKIHILYAEDDLLAKILLKEIMEEKDWEVIEAADGVEAVEKYNEFNPDLILLDINMPRRDGVEVMEIIRLTNLQTPILFYSTLADREDIKALISKYKNNYISNVHYRIDDVVDKIEKLLSDSSSIDDEYSKREKEEKEKKAESLKKRAKILRYAIIVMMLLSVLLSMMLLFSCTSKEESSSIPIFSKENAVDTVYMSSLIKDWHYVMLETKPECFIGRVGDINIDDSLLFIEASESGGRKSIFVFNKEGEFIRKIGCEGRARNEYIYIECWTIDKWNKEVLIADSFKRKLMRYTYDGSFLGDIPFNDNLLDVEDIYVISKTRLALKRGLSTDNIDDVMKGYEEQMKRELDKVLKSQSRFLVTDRELNLVSRLSNRGIISEDYPYSSISSSIFVNNTIYARDPILNDTLYRWKNNQFIPEYLIYVDDCRANDIDIDSKGIGVLRKKHSEEYKIFKPELMVNNRYFFTEGNKGLYFIDLKNNSIQHLKQDEPKNLSSPNAFYRLFSDKNCLIASRDATEILDLKKHQDEANIEVSSQEQKLYDSLEEDGNPVIFFYELKN